MYVPSSAYVPSSSIFFSSLDSTPLVTSSDDDSEDANPPLHSQSP